MKLQFIIIIFSLFFSFNLQAFTSSKNLERDSALIVDYDTGIILHQEKADCLRYPASLTKMMTVYLAFEAIKKGKTKLNKLVTVSQEAAKKPPSKLGLKKGQKISVKDLIYACIVKSANDAAVALSEEIAGNEDFFAKIMNMKAKQLGMNDTIFRNASGLHHVDQKTTAVDMAKLGIALRRDFPEYYHLFSKTSFTYNGKIINGHNRIVKKYKWADGLKTGFLNISGFNIVTSATKGKSRLVAVMMGFDTAQERDMKTIKLLSHYLKIKEPIFEKQLLQPAKKKRFKKLALKNKRTKRKFYKTSVNRMLTQKTNQKIKLVN